MVEEALGNIDFYSDPTPLDYSKLYQIEELAIYILQKKYGKDVRYSIANAFRRLYNDLSIDGNANIEVSLARGIFETLAERLNSADSYIDTLINDLLVLTGKLNGIVASAGDGTKPAELVDIRVAENGLIYVTAGDSVRKQFRDKISYSTGANIIDRFGAEVGWFYSATAGTRQADAKYQNNIIPSQGNVTYYMNIKANILIAFYDANGSFISGLVDPATFTTPANTKSFAISYTTAQSGLLMVSKSPITQYEAFIRGFDGTIVLDGTIPVSKIEKSARDKIVNAVTFKNGVNLLDVNNAVVGYYVSMTAGAKNANTDFQYNEISVNPSEVFNVYSAQNSHVAFFDSSGTFISGLLSPTSSFTSPAGAAKMTVSYNINLKNSIMVTRLKTTSYLPYETAIDGQQIAKQSITVDKLNKDITDIIGASGTIVNVGPGQTYTSLLKAINDHATKPNIIFQLVNYHVDMYQEYVDHYGDDFFTNYTGYDGSSDYNLRGYNLKFGDKLIADHRSSIKWTYDNSNDKVCTYFSPLNMTMNNYVKDLYIKITDGSCRYIVHDDFAWGKEGINHYDNCKFEGKSKFEQGIGGGFGFNSTYLIDTCKFINCGPDALTYHVNSGTGGKNKYIVKDTYLTPGSSIRGTYYGTSTEVSEMTVTGCRADKIYVKAHTIDGTSPNINLELTEWHNDVLPV